MDSLVQKAAEVRKNAYAPYSKFLVGAALETEEGKIFLGVNVENASYGATTCAERSAIFSAVSNGYKKFKRIAIVTDTSKPSVPCGLCLQVMYEFAPQLELIMATTSGKVEKTTLGKLLPKAFTL